MLPLLRLAVLALALLVSTPGIASEAAADLARKHLYAGTLAAGVDELGAKVAADPGDREARFGLGMVEFLRAVERLGQGFYRYGLRAPRTLSVPLLRLPVPLNPQAEPLTYEAMRGLLQGFTDDLAKAEATLGQVGGTDVSLVVDLLSVRLDFRGDGHAQADESLGRILSAMAGNPDRPVTDTPALEVRFRAGDAAWLRGYTHVLSALDEFLLAHDFHESFDVGAHLFFARAKTPYGELLTYPAPEGAGSWFPDSHVIADAISLLHTVNWPVTEPQRMARVRAHLLRMIALSRESWALINAETDDDREWIPNPRQTHAALGVRLNERQITAWFAALDESEAILEGRKLVPHWRFRQGFDAKKFFEEPRRFDLVMLIAGPATIPFLADGPMTTEEEWELIAASFEGSFFGYALWFN